MHTKEEVELFLLARGDGMTLREAAVFAGVGMGAAKRWSAGDLPRSYTGRPWGSGRIGVDEARATRGGARVKRIEIRGLYEPPETGPLAQMTSDQIEKLLLRAVLDDLKGAGSHPGSMSNRRKCELGERLRAATGLPLREITAFLRISSSYEYRRARLGRPDKYAALRARVRELFEEGSRNWGYRTVWARLRREGVSGSRRRWCAA